MTDLVSVLLISCSPKDGFFGTLAPEDATALRVVCCQALAAAAKYRGSLAFALTRHRLSTKRLSANSWSCLWESCIAEQKRVGYPDGIFARALDVATTDSTMPNCLACKQIPPHVAASLIKWTWQRVQANKSGLRASDVVDDRGDYEVTHGVVFRQVVDDEGKQCDLEPQWSSEELIAVLALKTYYVNRSFSERPSLLKLAGLIALDDGRFALLWSLWTMYGGNFQQDAPAFNLTDMEHGCTVFVGSSVTGLVQAASSVFAGAPVWMISDNRLDWAESTPGVCDRLLEPHYYCQTPEVCPPPKELFNSFTTILRGVVRGVPLCPEQPSQEQLMRERRLGFIFKQCISSTINPGDRVVLQGLVARPDLNGRDASVRAPVGRRWSADVAGLRAPVALKAENLVNMRDGNRDGRGEGAKEIRGAEALPPAEEEEGVPFMEVIHEEPAAALSAHESAQIAHEMWAGWVGELLTKRAELMTGTVGHGSTLAGPRSQGQSSSSASVPNQPSLPSTSSSDLPAAVGGLSLDRDNIARESDFGEKILVLRWSRNPREFESSLCQLPALEPIRAAAKAVGHACKHASGATVLLYPDQYDCVVKLLAGFELRPYHTVVNEAFRPLVEEAAAQLRSKANVRLRGDQSLAILSSAEDCKEVLVMEKTFFTLKHVPNATGKCASDAQTDPIGRGVRNPRAITTHTASDEATMQ